MLSFSSFQCHNVDMKLVSQCFQCLSLHAKAGPAVQLVWLTRLLLAGVQELANEVKMGF